MSVFVFWWIPSSKKKKWSYSKKKIRHHRVCLVKPRRMIYFFLRKGQVACWPEVNVRSVLVRLGNWTRKVAYPSTWQLIVTTLGAFPTLLLNLVGSYWWKTIISSNDPCDVIYDITKSRFCQNQHWSMQSVRDNNIVHTWDRITSFSEQNEQFQYFSFDL